MVRTAVDLWQHSLHRRLVRQPWARAPSIAAIVAGGLKQPPSSLEGKPAAKIFSCEAPDIACADGLA